MNDEKKIKILKTILENNNLDFSGSIALKNYFEKIDSSERDTILSTFESIFCPELYLYQSEALSCIEQYKSSGASRFIHGIYHVEKVFLYCYIMVQEYNKEHDEKIPTEFAYALYYAALYHDIGRVDNNEDISHGFNSAKIINVVCNSDEIVEKRFRKEVIEKLNEKIKNKFKDNKMLLYLTELLMTLHSTGIEMSDASSRKSIEGQINYYIEQIQANDNDEDCENTDKLREYAGKYLSLLCDFLKDADALDRKRFGEWTRESLNENYLRTPYSKLLVSFADEINKFYYEYMKIFFKNPDITQTEKRDCFHSVGFDFFKIGSILEYGVLSQEELKRNMIKVPRNFPGGNFDRWISVVDTLLYPSYAESANMFIKDDALEAKLKVYLEQHPEIIKSLEELSVQKDKERLSETAKKELKKIKEIMRNTDQFDPRAKRFKWASSEFTHHGITFYCTEVPLFGPETDKDKALEEGLPWNKSGYIDEKYAYERISPSNIIGLFIPQDCLKLKVKDLWYIYESTNMDIIRARVNYYVEVSKVSRLDKRIFDLSKLVDDYEMLVINELSQPAGMCNSPAYFKKSKQIMTDINKIIGEFVYEYYDSKLKEEKKNLDEVKIKDIVEYEIQKALQGTNIGYTIVTLDENNSNEFFFSIDHPIQKGKSI